MTRKFLTDVDLTNNHILNALLEVIAGNPGTTPLDARIWYDSSNNTVKVRINGVTVDLRDRGSQTGTQTASTISDFNATVLAIQWAAMAPPTSSVNMNGQQFSGVPAAASGGQVVEYAQFQAALANIQVGLDFKEHVSIVALAVVTIATPGATINGRAMVAGDRVLLTAQSTASQNGIWQWNGAAVPMTRTADSPTGNTGAVTAGTVVEGYNGTARVLYMQTATGTGTGGAIIVDTDTQTWINPYPAFTLAAGYGIGITGGNKVGFIPGTGMAAVGADGAAAGLDFTIVGRKLIGVLPTTTTGIYTVGAPSGGYTPVTINHNLGSVCPVFQLRVGSAGADPGQQIEADNKPPTVTDANNLTVQIPTSGFAANVYQFAIIA